MDAYLLDWINLLLRWAHVITAIAWIGASFYFVLLDNSLAKPEDAVHERWRTPTHGFATPGRCRPIQ